MRHLHVSKLCSLTHLPMREKHTLTYPDNHVRKRQHVAFASGRPRVDRIAAERGPLFSRQWLSYFLKRKSSLLIYLFINLFIMRSKVNRKGENKKR